LKIVTWNVNSIRRREGIVLDWLLPKPDVLQLQETRLPMPSSRAPGSSAAGWHLALHGQAGGRNGVATSPARRSTRSRAACPADG
jgi:exodeoxyribonuclease-3